MDGAIPELPSQSLGHGGARRLSWSPLPPMAATTRDTRGSWCFASSSQPPSATLQQHPHAKWDSSWELPAANPALQHPSSPAQSSVHAGVSEFRALSWGQRKLHTVLGPTRMKENKKAHCACKAGGEARFNLRLARLRLGLFASARFHTVSAFCQNRH